MFNVNIINKMTHNSKIELRLKFEKSTYSHKLRMEHLHPPTVYIYTYETKELLDVNAMIMSGITVYASGTFYGEVYYFINPESISRFVEFVNREQKYVIDYHNMHLLLQSLLREKYLTYDQMMYIMKNPVIQNVEYDDYPLGLFN